MSDIHANIGIFRAVRKSQACATFRSKQHLAFITLACRRCNVFGTCASKKGRGLGWHGGAGASGGFTKSAIQRAVSNVSPRRPGGHFGWGLGRIVSASGSSLARRSSCSSQASCHVSEGELILRGGSPDCKAQFSMAEDWVKNSSSDTTVVRRMNVECPGSDLSCFLFCFSWKQPFWAG